MTGRKIIGLLFSCMLFTVKAAGFLCVLNSSAEEIVYPAGLQAFEIAGAGKNFVPV